MSDDELESNPQEHSRSPNGRSPGPYCGKRGLDVMAAAAACAVFTPAAAVVTLATWLEDGGPPLFLQTRVGCGREPFTKPGITGLSQLFGGRSARASLRLDRLYLQRQSLSLDLQLIALSLAANVVGKRTIRRLRLRREAA